MAREGSRESSQRCHLCNATQRACGLPRTSAIQSCQKSIQILAAHACHETDGFRLEICPPSSAACSPSSLHVGHANAHPLSPHFQGDPLRRKASQAEPTRSRELPATSTSWGTNAHMRREPGEKKEWQQRRNKNLNALSLTRLPAHNRGQWETTLLGKRHCSCGAEHLDTWWTAPPFASHRSGDVSTHVRCIHPCARHLTNTEHASAKRIHDI